MRYHYQKPDIYLSMYGELYICNHPVYDRCTLFTIGDKGLAVIQQRFRALRRRITMEHSKNYSKVKLWYRMKMWNETKVRNAVKMGWITKEEFAEITGKDYE